MRPRYETPFLTLFHTDNMELMRQLPANYFDLAIVDPPYGIGEDGKSNHSRGTKRHPGTMFKPKKWDKTPPPQEFFNQLRRISKNQIIFGANHFISRLPYDSPCWIVWDKDRTGDFADCELAWTSFNTAVRKFTFRWNGMLQGDMKNKEKRIHPTQKPVRLYEWILKNYAKPGDRLIDTNFGSGSIAIAAHKVNNNDNMNLHITACELDADYISDAVKRIKNATCAQTLKFDQQSVINQYQQQ